MAPSGSDRDDVGVVRGGARGDDEASASEGGVERAVGHEAEDDHVYLAERVDDAGDDDAAVGLQRDARRSSAELRERERGHTPRAERRVEGAVGREPPDRQQRVRARGRVPGHHDAVVGLHGDRVGRGVVDLAAEGDAGGGEGGVEHAGGRVAHDGGVVGERRGVEDVAGGEDFCVDWRASEVAWAPLDATTVVFTWPPVPKLVTGAAPRPKRQREKSLAVPVVSQPATTKPVASSRIGYAPSYEPLGGDVERKPLVAKVVSRAPAVVRRVTKKPLVVALA